MAGMSDLPNIGKVLERELQAVGISTPEQLAQAGSKEVFLRIRQLDPGACLRKLCALQGAIEGIRDTRLSEDTKQDLKQFFNRVQGRA